MKASEMTNFLSLIIVSSQYSTWPYTDMNWDVKVNDWELTGLRQLQGVVSLFKQIKTQFSVTLQENSLHHLKLPASE